MRGLGLANFSVQFHVGILRCTIDRPIDPENCQLILSYHHIFPQQNILFSTALTSPLQYFLGCPELSDLSML